MKAIQCHSLVPTLVLGHKRICALTKEFIFSVVLVIETVAV